MAEKTCTYRNPLVRDGTSQSQRMPEALDPDYAKIDDRSLADLLRFVVQFAEELQYYSPDNKLSGDWRDFFAHDVTAVIALLTDETPDVYQQCIDKIEEKLFENDTSPAETRKLLKILFDLIGTLAVKVDSWYKKAPEGFEFRDHLHRSITAELRGNLKKAIAFYKGAHPDNEHLLNSGHKDDGTYCSEDLHDFEKISDAELGAIWMATGSDETNSENWETYYDDIPGDPSIYQADHPTINNRARAGFSYVERTALGFVNALRETQHKTPDFIEETLTEYPAHEPQMGLLLTFFKLFRYAQEHINTITRRHLNFYYEDVLKLERQEALPDKAYLLVELAKHIESHKIDAETLFKAGKDAAGNEVLYKAIREVVLNKAQVSGLKSVYIDKEKDFEIFDKPVANSKDGTGTELEDPSQGWKAFGEKQTGDTATMQFSEIGFALSSPVLVMAEGVRKINLDITYSGEADIDFKNLFRCKITGAEGWMDASLVNPTSKEGGGSYSLTVEIPQRSPAVVSFNTELHDGRFDTRWPVLKLALKKSGESHNYGYGDLKDIRIEDITIDTDVSGVKNLVLQNELGVLDATKPVKPFGPRPALEAEFYIGSREVFSKNLKKLTLSFQWLELPDFNNHYNHYINDYSPDWDDFKADIDVLNNGSWSDVANNQSLLSGPSTDDRKSFEFRSKDTDVSLLPDSEPELNSFSQLGIAQKRGFVRLVLKSPDEAFGHRLYSKSLTKQVVGKMEDKLPNEPYTPTIKGVVLSYNATETVSPLAADTADERNNRFFHLYPFGKQEIRDEDGDSIPLLPPFNHTKAGTVWHHGEFYIGLTGFELPRQVSLLFKIAEGSADPSLPKQKLDWFFLTESGWKAIDPQDIVHDSTNGLLTTGIIRFNIPEAATSQSRIFPGSEYWIRAAVPQHTEAICRIIDVQAQAMTVRFEDDDNDPDFLSSVIEAGSISKLKTKQSEVKKIIQPYASEGGKVAEKDVELHRRVSERLRHKERGVAIWDYERLVLEHFPEVYKVKCINHSTYHYATNGDTISSEFAPGYVSLVVLPNLKNQQAVEPLKPSLSLNTRNQIQQFLAKRTTPFLKDKLKVVNPLFEQVEADFNVKLYDEMDAGYYQDLLEQDIVRFLSPWAFEEGRDIAFGGGIHKSVILNFVEERPYVDYVTNFKINHYIAEEPGSMDVDQVVVTTARSILVSHKSHQVKAIKDTE